MRWMIIFLHLLSVVFSYSRDFIYIDQHLSLVNRVFLTNDIRFSTLIQLFLCIQICTVGGGIIQTEYFFLSLSYT